jgi:hypothetical protein
MNDSNNNASKKEWKPATKSLKIVIFNGTENSIYGTFFQASISNGHQATQSLCVDV